MTTHREPSGHRRIRPHATPKPAKPPKPAPLAVDKYAALKYDYATVAEADRATVQDAALAIKRWQRDTITVGKTFLAVKELLPHRQFLDWMEIEFGLKERSIQSIMNVARIYGEPEKAQRVALLSAGALYELAAPSTPEAARLEVEAHIAAGQTPTRAQVKRMIAAYMPAREQKPKQLTGPVAEPEPEPDAIEAEYTVIPAAPSFAEWLAAMPADLSLRDHLAILELAKGSATKLRNVRPALYNAVSNVMMQWSQLIHAVEQELRK
jgi:hypothetical protein